MSAKAFALIMSALSLAYQLVLSVVADRQRKKPLPKEVADVFAPERYQKYLSYVADNKKLGFAMNAVGLIETALLLLLFPWRGLEDAMRGNVYGIALASVSLIWLIDAVKDVVAAYIDKFRIEEKYGMNRQTKRDFAKDQARSLAVELLLELLLTLLIAFMGEHMASWTNGFSVSLPKALGIGVGIAAVIGAFITFASLVSIWMMKREYTFTPLPDGALRDKIVKLQDGARKRVKQINVYDESKKSTSKNAFLLKFLWLREFGIADNFINENAEEELIAVLSHEIGHLKHKKNLLNYLSYALFSGAFALVILIIHRPAPVRAMAAWVRASFALTVNNYNLLITVFGAALTPVIRLISLLNNYRSRMEEYEADREAVRNGCGEALIATFKRLSSDELINVNPHPLIEFLEYDHLQDTFQP